MAQLMEDLNQSCLAIEYVYCSAVVRKRSLTDLLLVQYYALVLDLFVALEWCKSIHLDENTCYRECEDKILLQPKKKATLSDGVEELFTVEWKQTYSKISHCQYYRNALVHDNGRQAVLRILEFSSRKSLIFPVSFTCIASPANSRY